MEEYSYLGEEIGGQSGRVDLDWCGGGRGSRKRRVDRDPPGRDMKDVGESGDVRPGKCVVWIPRISSPRMEGTCRLSGPLETLVLLRVQAGAPRLT